MYAHTAYGWNKVSLQTTKLRQIIYTYKAFLLSCWEKAMATHYNTLAWKIPWMEESGGLQSVGSLRVRHD